MAGNQKNKEEEIDQQLEELIENTKLQTTTLKKLMAEMERRTSSMKTKESNKKEES